MRNVVGKTIARIEEHPTSPAYGYARDDTLLIHFTDGTAMIVEGSSYDIVNLNWQTADRDDIGQWRRAAMGRRERERLWRLRRQEYEALPVEVREAREAARRAKLPPVALALENELRAQAREWRMDMNRMGYWDAPQK